MKKLKDSYGFVVTPGSRTVIRHGEVIPDDHPAIAAHPEAFEDAEPSAGPPPTDGEE